MKAFLTLSLACVLYLSGAASVTYSVLDLGSVAGDSYALGINASRVACGFSQPPSDYARATIFDHGVATQLGSLGEMGSYAESINSAGDCVGVFYDSDFQPHAFIYDGAQMIDVFHSSDPSSAYAINDQGVFVGQHKSGLYTSDAYYFDNSLHHIGSLGGKLAVATAVNESLQIAGGSLLADNQTAHAFLYSDGVMTDIGTLGGANSSATGINESGSVVGWANNLGVFAHAFLYDGTMHDLGSLLGGISEALSINDSGEIVGETGTPDAMSHHGFIWVAGVMYDLNDLLEGDTGYVIVQAEGINNDGIVAAGGYDGMDHYALLLTPHYPIEPSGYTLYRGRYVSGGLGDLLDSDDAYLRVYPGLVMNGFEAPVQVVVTGTARSLSHYSDLRLKLEAHVSSPNLRQTIELYDYQSGQWVNLDTSTGTPSDSVRTAIAPDPSRFVQFLTNEVKARLSWKPAGLVNAWPWTASLDQVQWTVTP